MKIDSDFCDIFNISTSNNEKCTLVTYLNPYSYYAINGKQVEFTRLFSDGILLVWLYNFFNDDKIERYSFDFTSCAPVVFEHCVSKKLKVALVGSSESEIKKAVSVIENRFEGLNIVFYHHGFIKGKEHDVIKSLDESGVNVVICGMGTPFQEEFLIKCRDSVDTLRFGFTCGGFLSQISSNENYFHPIMDRLNLRWLQRFYRHGYVRKRIFFDYPKFVVKFILENLKK